MWRTSPRSEIVDGGTERSRSWASEARRTSRPAWRGGTRARPRASRVRPSSKPGSMRSTMPVHVCPVASRRDTRLPTVILTTQSCSRSGPTRSSSRSVPTTTARSRRGSASAASSRPAVPLRTGRPAGARAPSTRSGSTVRRPSEVLPERSRRSARRRGPRCCHVRDGQRRALRRGRVRDARHARGARPDLQRRARRGAVPGGDEPRRDRRDRGARTRRGGGEGRPHRPRDRGGVRRVPATPTTGSATACTTCAATTTR